MLFLLSGTTLHAQAGCGIINMWNDFGKMWQKPAIDKWQAIKVRRPACVGRSFSSALSALCSVFCALQTMSQLGPQCGHHAILWK